MYTYIKWEIMCHRYVRRQLLAAAPEGRVALVSDFQGMRGKVHSIFKGCVANEPESQCNAASIVALLIVHHPPPRSAIIDGSHLFLQAWQLSMSRPTPDPNMVTRSCIPRAVKCKQDARAPYVYACVFIALDLRRSILHCAKYTTDSDLLFFVARRCAS